MDRAESTFLRMILSSPPRSITMVNFSPGSGAHIGSAAGDLAQFPGGFDAVPRGNLFIGQNVIENSRCLSEMPLRCLSRCFTTKDATLSLGANRMEQGHVTGQLFPIFIAQFVLGLDFKVGDQPFRVAGTVSNEGLAHVGVEGYRDAAQAHAPVGSGARISEHRRSWRPRQGC